MALEIATSAFGTPDARSLTADEGADDMWAGWDAESKDATVASLPGSNSGWAPVDLTDVLAGTWEPPEPTIGRRDDGVGMFYAGRQHTIASESEAGKTWLLLAAALVELNAGNAVVYVDFEDDEGGIVGRLLTLGAERAIVRDRFAYVRPEHGIDVVGKAALEQVLGDLRPTLAILDGVTEAMVMHGLDPLSNADVAMFGRRLPGWLASHGPAVVSADHVPKSTENRGRYALGAGHKLAGLNGAAYTLTSRQPFGVGITGRSTLLITKDRPGQLRRHALPSGEGAHWFADLVLNSHGNDFAEASINAPARRDDVRFRPTVLMQRVSEAITFAGTPLSGKGVEDRVKGRAADIRTALAALVDENFVVIEPGAHGARLHRLVREFGAES